MGREHLRSSTPKPPRPTWPVLRGPFDFTLHRDQEGWGERRCLLGGSAHLRLAPHKRDEASLCWAEVSLSTPKPWSAAPTSWPRLHGVSGVGRRRPAFGLALLNVCHAVGSRRSPEKEARVMRAGLKPPSVATLSSAQLRSTNSRDLQTHVRAPGAMGTLCSSVTRDSSWCTRYSISPGGRVLVAPGSVTDFRTRECGPCTCVY